MQVQAREPIPVERPEHACQAARDLEAQGVRSRRTLLGRASGSYGAGRSGCDLGAAPTGCSGMGADSVSAGRDGTMSRLRTIVAKGEEAARK